MNGTAYIDRSIDLACDAGVTSFLALLQFKLMLFFALGLHRFVRVHEHAWFLA
jgi:hypothetical protein